MIVPKLNLRSKSNKRVSSSQVVEVQSLAKVDVKDKNPYNSNTIYKDGLVIGGCNPLTGKPFSEKQMKFFNRKKIAQLEAEKEKLELEVKARKRGRPSVR